VPYYVVTFDPGSFLDPATVATDGYSYDQSDNRLASIAEAGGHTRAFTYSAADRLATFSINGVVQANYRYNAEGQQVVSELTQTGETIHVVHDPEGNRIAEYSTMTRPAPRR
jgi:YD repeat-containing protein